MKDVNSVNTKVNEFKQAFDLIKSLAMNDEIITSKNLVTSQNFHFNCEIGASDAQLMEILDICTRDNLSSEVFVSMSALALESKKFEFSQECLKRALISNMNQTIVNVKECLKIYIRLIQLSQKKEVTLPFFEDALKLIKGSYVSEDVGDLVKWIVSECWNNGVYFYKLLSHVKAEQWSKLSYNLAMCLEDRDELKKRITEGYGDLLKRFEIQNVKSVDSFDFMKFK